MEYTTRTIINTIDNHKKPLKTITTKEVTRLMLSAGTIWTAYKNPSSDKERAYTFWKRVCLELIDYYHCGGGYGVISHNTFSFSMGCYLNRNYSADDSIFIKVTKDNLYIYHVVDND